MKAVVVRGVNEFGVEEIELLPPEAHDVRIKMKACDENFRDRPF